MLSIWFCSWIQTPISKSRLSLRRPTRVIIYYLIFSIEQIIISERNVCLPIIGLICSQWIMLVVFDIFRMCCHFLGLWYWQILWCLKRHDRLLSICWLEILLVIRYAIYLCGMCPWNFTNLCQIWSRVQE